MGSALFFAGCVFLAPPRAVTEKAEVSRTADFCSSQRAKRVAEKAELPLGFCFSASGLTPVLKTERKKLQYENHTHHGRFEMPACKELHSAQKG